MHIPQPSQGHRPHGARHGDLTGGSSASLHDALGVWDYAHRDAFGLWVHAAFWP